MDSRVPTHKLVRMARRVRQRLYGCHLDMWQTGVIRPPSPSPPLIAAPRWRQDQNLDGSLVLRCLDNRVHAKM
jgi:hypothetical protein